MALNDNSIMPYGKHKGKAMANVPAQYLLYCYENNKCRPDVAFYVRDNQQVLKSQLTKKQKYELYGTED